MRRPSVLVIDAGLGNIGSVVFAFAREECTVKKLSRPPERNLISEYSHLVLPGVGSFKAGMRSLENRGWSNWIIDEWYPLNKPLLGICLGMQLLATNGTEGVDLESKYTKGLNLIPGTVDRMDPESGLSLPHVGWNCVNWINQENEIGAGLPKAGDFYFVHTYAFKPERNESTIAYTNYGARFTSVVKKGLCFGVQFHPEKSQKLGKRLLRNFLTL